MSLSLRIAANPWRPSIHQGCKYNGFIGTNIHRVSLPFFSPHMKHNSCWTHKISNDINNHHFVAHSVDAGGHTAHDASDPQNCSAESEGSTEGKDSKQGRSTTTKILGQLKRYGVSGILSYGLLNTMYYLSAFLVVWFYIAPVPGKMGYLAAAGRFLKVMAMVWAGSQITKVMRAAGALALAPFVDRGLSWFTARYKFESRGKAFFTVVGFCLGLAVILFLVVTLLWA